ncbi:MAG: ATP-dependent zinc metalloprotease FtsH [Fimbriimonadales bacterium]|nr:MAG: ATP-dependent zinc metalloprotease FtsH [Fimbriimonadales bacterium]
MNSRVRTLIIAVAFVVLVVWFLSSQGGVGLIPGMEPPREIAVAQLVQDVKANRVNEVVWDGDRLTAIYKDGSRRIAIGWQYGTDAGLRLYENLTNEGFDKVTVKRPLLSEGMVGLLMTFLLPVLIIVGLWFLLIRPAQSGGNPALNFGRSRAKRVNESIPKVTFDDVAGVDEAKQELEEIVDFLKNTKKYVSLGAKIPKGVLLTGPPGCGKTHLARAVAGEAGVPFFHISGSDFVEMFVGVGAARVRDLFETAKAHRPSLIFVDEIDAVGRQRGAGLGGGHDEREQTLNQLLVEMDGFDPNTGVILIAATNRPDVLDPALLRPGRFDRQIVVDAPDAKGREEILKIHARGKPLADDVRLDVIAKRTPGFTGADLANTLNEAALLAARRGKNRIEMEDIEEALDRVIAGPQRRSRVVDKKERETIAYHEAGHAVVGELLEHTDPVHKVTILPRGMSLGSTWQLPVQDKYLVTRAELMDEITALLGGRVAEEIVFGEVTTGASNDLERVTRIARAMVCRYGMSEKLGTLALGRQHANPFLGRDYLEDRDYSEEVARLIDQEVREIVETCHRRATEILMTNREKLDAVVAVLLEKETIGREEFLEVMGLEDRIQKEQQSADPTGGEGKQEGVEAQPEGGQADSEGTVPPRLKPGTAET